jgi:hypothetical protein
MPILSREEQQRRRVWACACGMIWPAPRHEPERMHLWDRWLAHLAGEGHQPVTPSDARAARQEQRKESAA